MEPEGSPWVAAETQEATEGKGCTQQSLASYRMGHLYDGAEDSGPPQKGKDSEQDSVAWQRMKMATSFTVNKLPVCRGRWTLNGHVPWGQGQTLPCSLGMKSRGPAPPDGGQEILLGRPPGRRNLCPSPSTTLAFEASNQPLPLGVLMGS